MGLLPYSYIPWDPLSCVGSVSLAIAITTSTTSSSIDTPFELSRKAAKQTINAYRLRTIDTRITSCTNITSCIQMT